MPARVDLTGQRFGRLVVLEYDGLHNKKAKWKCQCDCGSRPLVLALLLRTGKTTSCGCYRAEKMSITKRTHGQTRTAEYQTYQRMIARCCNPKNERYYAYGGRGITICDRWKASFQNFYDDMGPRPDGCSIERIDVNGNYEPSNCRWATLREQSRNTRRTIHFTHEGKTMCLTDWANHFGVSVQTAYKRYARGLSFNKVFGVA